ncbi:MAG: Gfo/Idh/MocA family oxidoreductase [Verrucomicrobiae bacterium]|nr:Gfo/Idh/MocA family oxidoreductase [Verrucomicrobiae bacterium]
MGYAPERKPGPVCGPGDFPFAAAALDHGHIYDQCAQLIAAGGELRAVFDPDAEKVRRFREKFPVAQAADSLDRILDDPAIRLVASAAVPSERGPLGCRVMQAGKDYFTDKAPFTSLDQLEEARRVAQATGRKYAVYYGERLHTESGAFIGWLIRQGVIGKVLQVLGLGPHRLAASHRPAWFFEKAKYGGILCDIGCHQTDQFLHYTGAKDARVTHSAVANYDHPQWPELEDFGEASLVAEHGATNYFRVDWFTPDGLRTWGDGRTVILGTQGYLETRKYIDVARNAGGEHLFLVTREKERYFSVRGKIGLPYCGDLILDCLNRTEKAMTQAHAFKAAELALCAQARAERLA